VSDLALRGLRVGSRLGPLDLDLAAGHLTVVLGPNGAGKSTLLSALAGLVRPDGGTLRLGDLDLDRLRPVGRAAHTAWLPQSPRAEDGVTALEAVAAARYRHREPVARREAHALEALGTLGLEAFAPRPMHTLSGGEAQRVRMAALLAQDATWWLLDEPMNHLDPAVRLSLCKVLTDRVSTGGSVVLVSHDLGLLPHLGPARVVLLANGRVVHQGCVTDPALAEPLGAAFGIRLHRVPVGAHWAFVAEGARP